MVTAQANAVVGTSDEKMWTQAQVWKDMGGGQRWAVLKLTKSEEATLVNLAEMGVEMLRELGEVDWLMTDQVAAQALIKKIIGDSVDGVQIEVVLGQLAGDEMRLVGSGGGQAYLYRGGRIAKLDKTGEEWYVKGVVQGSDRILLTTSNGAEKLGLAQIGRLLSEEEGLAEGLAVAVQAKEDKDGVAVVSVEITSEKSDAISGWWRGVPTLPRLQQEGGKASKYQLWVGLAVLGILVVMVGLGVVKKQRMMQEQAWNELNTAIVAKTGEATALAEQSPERTKTLLNEARGLVESYLASKRSEKYQAEAIKLKAGVDRLEEQLWKKNQVQLTTVVELGVLDSELKSLSMQTDGKNSLVWMDQSQGKVVSMNLNDRSKVVLEKQKDMPEGAGISVSEDKLNWLGEGGVWEASWKKREWKQVIEADEFWQQPSQIGVFAGNLYVFDRAQSEIWKYPVLSDGYGARRRWLAAGITPDLSKVVAMKVNGDIWLLTETGKVVRYSRGAPGKFELTGLPFITEDKFLQNPSSMFVTENAIYIAENGANRVVAISQEGKFEAQYVNEEFAKIDDLVILDGKAYVLMDNVVKEFGL